MTTNSSIKLLGAPEIISGAGCNQGVRGHQAWAVLARVLLSRRPVSRRDLAAELFSETADPLGALRWCLAALRRALDEPSSLRGDPIEPNIPEGCTVDVWQLERERTLPSDAGQLLEGVELRSAPTFSSWLLVERERLAALVDEQLRSLCLAALSTGNSKAAIGYAEQAVRRNSFEEAPHILLVKSLVAAGRSEAAMQHVEATERSFRGELGEPPSPALRSAARRSVSSPAAGVSPESYARSLIDAGKAAVAAGATDAGLESLRRAVSEADRTNASPLRAQAYFELGTALIHTVRGFDEEGAVVVRQAAALAEASGDADMQAAALRELGYVEALAGRRPAAADYLNVALGLASESDRIAGVQSVIGFNLVDWGRADEGLRAFESAIELARRSGNRRREAWCLGVGARGLTASRAYAASLDWLGKCLTIVNDLQWLAFRPWAVALRAENQLLLGQSPQSLRPELEDAFALSCQLNDPCWEGAICRVRALTHEAEGDLEEALLWLASALMRTCRDVNRFAAQEVDILEDRARILRRIGRETEALRTATEWLSLAARTHMEASISRAAAFVSAPSARSGGNMSGE